MYTLEMSIISQFSCSSSLILLTHPDFEKVAGFKINIVADPTRQVIWSNGDPPNGDITFSSYLCVFEPQMETAKLFSLIQHRLSASILTPKPVTNEQGVQQRFAVPIPKFPSNPKEGVVYRAPEKLFTEIPQKKGIKAHKIPYGSFSLTGYTNENGVAVVVLE
jgi:hypothetical protein